MSPSPSSAKTASAPDSFFTATLEQADPEIAAAIKGELGRQRHEIELIASENIVSRAVLEAQGSVMTNKYAEGYPGKRYYGGTPKAIPASAIMAAANSSMSPRRWRSSAPRSCSAASSPMCSRTPAAR